MSFHLKKNDNICKVIIVIYFLNDALILFTECFGILNYTRYHDKLLSFIHYIDLIHNYFYLQ